MPGNTGCELAATLRRDEAASGMKLILVTSAPTAQLSGQDSDVVFDYVLPKPVRQRVLLVHLLDLIERKRSAPVPGDPIASNPGNGLNILVVDDVVVNQKVAAGMLTRLHHQVDFATDGAEAVSKVSAFDYDLILMDVQMPGMNGLDATAAIRSLGGHRAVVPIIAMTANAMEGDREFLLEAGMNDYISKPFSMSQLSTLVAGWSQRLH